MVDNHETPAGHIEAAERLTAYHGRQDISPAHAEKDPLESKTASLAYFGPDLDDPAVHRRVAQWHYAGFRVLTLAFSRRGRSAAQIEDVVSLGYVTPQSRARRIIPLVTAGLRLIARRRKLQQCDVFVARNLDNGFIALFARWIAGMSIPLVYEVLDINLSCTKAGLQGRLFRRLEKWMLSHATLLVVSSPHFVWAYYQGMLQFRANWLLFENKVPKYALPPAAPTVRPGAGGDVLDEPIKRRRWRIGWFGYLDDNETWRILKQLARELPDRVFIQVRGMPYTNFDTNRFLADVEQLPNVAYGGPYRSPEDLADVYGSVDIVWSMDFNFPATNSKWLLTNGLYEAGYFGKPVLGLVGTAVGQALGEWNSGWCLREPVALAVVEFLDKLTVEEYAAKCRAIAQLDPALFVETDEIEQVLAVVQGQKVRQDALAAPRRVEAIR